MHPCKVMTKIKEFKKYFQNGQPSKWRSDECDESFEGEINKNQVGRNMQVEANNAIKEKLKDLCLITQGKELAVSEIVRQCNSQTEESKETAFFWQERMQ